MMSPKKVILIFIVFAIIAGSISLVTAQYYLPSYEKDWQSFWDTTVVYSGDLITTPHLMYSAEEGWHALRDSTGSTITYTYTCDSHEWVYKKQPTLRIVGVCGVVHDSRGCPDLWEVKERICNLCYRKEILKERREFIDLPPDPYPQLDSIATSRIEVEE